MLSTVIKYINTLKYLTFEQLFFQVYYKLRKYARMLIGYRASISLYKRGIKLSPKVSWINKLSYYKGGNRFNILNQEYIFSGKWDDVAYTALWRYNLNYMDFILQKDFSIEEGICWIDNFISSIPVNKIAFDPYPISLRGMNWIKFVSQNYDNLTSEQIKKIDTALYSQYHQLLNSTERHLMANHYLENGFSLLFAAYYFDDEKIYKASERILLSQLKEQILTDGAHFELSPMYHCIILERILDCYNIIDAQKHKHLNHIIYESAIKMLGWLDAVVDVNDEIPLFNDSAREFAMSPSQIRDYASALGLKWSSVVLRESGYRRWRKGNYEVIADVAALGPSYNLGHSHADTFSFVMNVGSEPFIVDSGTSTYEAGLRRNYERSTSSHNTVSLKEKNSSNVWGAFRCAERATVTIINEREDSIKAEHNGYESVGVRCVREFVCNDDTLEITDELLGNYKEYATARIHLAPQVKIVDVRDNAVVTSLGTISFIGAGEINIKDVYVAFKYNALESAKCISVKFENNLKTRITF